MRTALILPQVPPRYAFPGAPLQLAGNVTTGFGRGSRDLGFPTANLPPAPLQEQLQHLPSGVYFGWEPLQQACHLVLDPGASPPPTCRPRRCRSSCGTCQAVFSSAE